MAIITYTFEWSELVFSSKKLINDLNAYFIAAPREISVKRFNQLIKEYLPKGNILLGIAKEPFIAGFEAQPQFKSLKLNDIQVSIDKVNAASPKNKIYILNYSQSDFQYIMQKIDVNRVILINGSWQYAFHTQKPFYEIVKRGIKYKMTSPFADSKEAQQYAQTIKNSIEQSINIPVAGKKLDDIQMLALSQQASKQSFDYNFQTGLSLGKINKEGTYDFLTTTYNKVVPYQTYAMHFGAAREKNFSPPHDLNHYDTVHAEVALLIKAQDENIELEGTTLFINLLPCPPCSRMLGETSIVEFVYIADHSDGYALRMLQAAGKKVRRLVPPQEDI